MDLKIDDATYLGASVVETTCNQEHRMVLTLRLQENDFGAHNIAFTPAQAVRIWRDINLMMAGSSVLKDAIAANPDDYVGFAETMSLAGIEQYTKALSAIRAANPPSSPKVTRKRKS